MTPGTYLRLRREAADLSIEDVAARLATEPRIAEHARVEWIALIEAGQMPAAFRTIVALRCAFDFDIQVLETLVVADLGYASQPLRICRACGCSDDNACDGGCWWVAGDLCSACVGPATMTDLVHAAAQGAA